MKGLDFLLTALSVQKFIFNNEFWVHNFSCLDLFSLKGYQANENKDLLI